MSESGSIKKIRTILKKISNILVDHTNYSIGLAPERDGRLITVAAFITQHRPDQLRFQLGKAVENGWAPEELIETIRQLAFYAGWPSAMAVLFIAQELLA